jgi:hypothetical protein
VLRDRLTEPNLSFPKSQVFELSDGAAGKARWPTHKSVIEAAIQDFTKSCREQDRIIVLFAGHAVHLEEKSYLIPAAGSTTDAATLVPLQWVFEQLASCKAQQKILILDVFRYAPKRGNFRATGGDGDEGTMPEDFEKSLLNPPAGVQVWRGCLKEQNSIELDNGSVFLQALGQTMQVGSMKELSPNDPIPIDAMVADVNKRMKDLLAPQKRVQESQLTGTKSAKEVECDPTQPLPEAVKLTLPAVPEGGAADKEQVKKVLDEVRLLLPARGTRAADVFSDDILPMFPAKALDEYEVDGYKNITELQKRYAGMTKDDRLKFDEEFPLRGAYFRIIDALNESGKINLRTQLAPPVNQNLKTAILKEQNDLAGPIFKLEQALYSVKMAAKERGKEKSKRWQANFDLAHARLGMRLVFLFEYSYTLGRVRSDDLPELAMGQNGWRVGAAKKIAVTEKKAKDLVKESKAILNRVVSNNPDTPWAILAQRDREIYLGAPWLGKGD